MANRLKMAEIHSIQTLRTQGWSQRRIARALGVDRETVARYVRAAAAPQNQPNPPTGSEGPRDPPVGGQNQPNLPLGSTGPVSQCEPFRELIRGALERGLSARTVFGTTREQRCWVHKTANVLNYLPTSKQGQAKQGLHDIWRAETKAAAERAFDLFLAQYGPKYPKAAACLAKDRDTLLTFYDFPAEHWVHLRTTNPIESTFATVRLRTDKTKGCGSRAATLTMVFKSLQSAEQYWRLLNGAHLLQDLLAGVRFEDGLRKDAA